MKRLILLCLLVATCAYADFNNFLNYNLIGGTCKEQKPGLDVTPDDYVFPNQSTNTTRSTNIALTNSGNAALTDIAFQPFSNAVFTHSPSATSPCGTTLAAKATCYRKVSFTPAAATAYTGVLTIASNQLDDVTVGVSGTGTAADVTLTDNFDGTNARPYTRNNWVTATGGGVPETVSNQLLGYTAPATLYRSDWVGGADQCSSAVIAGSGSQSGLAVRMSTTDQTYYYVQIGDTSVMAIYKVLAGTATLLGSGSASAAVGDTIKLCVSGTTLTAYKNGLAVNTKTGQSDIATGYPGFRAGGGFAKFDDWIGELP